MISVRSLIGIGMCGLVSVLGSNNVVFAQTAQTTERLAALESKTDELEKKWMRREYGRP